MIEIINNMKGQRQYLIEIILFIEIIRNIASWYFCARSIRVLKCQDQCSR